MPSTAELSTADILDKAADLVAKLGHNKGKFRAEDGALCVRGAIVRAVSPRYSFVRNRWTPIAATRATAELERHIVRTTGWFGVTTWNDAPERTKEEVVSTLRAAARAARAEQ